MINIPRYIKIREAARLLAVSESTVRRWLAEGRLEGFRVRGVVRVDREFIDRFVEAHPYAVAARKGRPSALSRLGRSWRGMVS